MTMFSCRLKLLRKESGLSQGELAEKLGIQSNTISTWERGTRRPNLEMTRKLSSFFGVSVAFLLGETDDLGDAEISIVQSSNGGWEEIIRRIPMLSENAQKYLLESARFVLKSERLL